MLFVDFGVAAGVVAFTEAVNPLVAHDSIEVERSTVDVIRKFLDQS